MACSSECLFPRFSKHWARHIHTHTDTLALWEKHSEKRSIFLTTSHHSVIWEKLNGQRKETSHHGYETPVSATHTGAGLCVFVCSCMRWSIDSVRPTPINPCLSIPCQNVAERQRRTLHLITVQGLHVLCCIFNALGRSSRVSLLFQSLPERCVSPCLGLGGRGFCLFE